MDLLNEIFYCDRCQVRVQVPASRKIISTRAVRSDRALALQLWKGQVWFEIPSVEGL
jgi:hypothetical protein